MKKKPIVLFVDDDEEQLKQWETLFKNDHEVRTAKNEEGAIQLVRTLECEAILFLDYHLGGGRNGLEVLTRLFANVRYPLVVNFVTGDSSLQGTLLGIRGVYGCHLKPVKPEVIQASINNIGKEILDLKFGSTHDPLTGLLNRRGLEIAAVHELAFAARDMTVTACINVDVDDLKPINDVYGHSSGDRAIEHIASQLREHARMNRKVDLVSRIGGDEFVAILPRTSFENALFIAKQLEIYVAESTIPVEDKKSGTWRRIQVGITTGVAVLDPSDIHQDNYEKTLWNLVKASNTVMEEQKKKKKVGR